MSPVAAAAAERIVQIREGAFWWDGSASPPLGPPCVWGREPPVAERRGICAHSSQRQAPAPHPAVSLQPDRRQGHPCWEGLERRRGTPTAGLRACVGGGVTTTVPCPLPPPVTSLPAGAQPLLCTVSCMEASCKLGLQLCALLASTSVGPWESACGSGRQWVLGFQVAVIQWPSLCEGAWGGREEASLFFSCHLHKGQALLCTRQPAWCLASAQWQMTTTGAPSNSGQKVTPDVPGCLAASSAPCSRVGEGGVCLCTCMWTPLGLCTPAALPSPSEKRELRAS